MLPNDFYQIKYGPFTQTYFNEYGDFLGNPELESIGYGEGYMISMENSFDNFVVSGNRYNPIITPLIIGGGWNWEPFIPSFSLPVSDALSTIEGDVSVVKTQAQSAMFLNGEWIGDLTEMNPGKMYKIYKTEEDTINLWYPDSTALDLDRTLSQSNNANWNLLKNTKSNMICMADFNFANNRLTNSDRYSIGVFDTENSCRSIGTYFDNFWYFTVVGNQNEEELSIKVWDNYTKKYLENDGNIIFEEDTISGSIDNPLQIRVDKNSDNEQPKVSLGQNYPNPFNPTTTIDYFLPEKSSVKISIFNILGQEVTVLEKGIKESGNHSIVWNATEFSSGIYFYKIKTPKTTITRKSILLK